MPQLSQAKLLEIASRIQALRDFPFGGAVVIDALTEMLERCLETEEDGQRFLAAIERLDVYPGPGTLRQIALEAAGKAETILPEFQLEPPPEGVCRKCRGTGYRIERLICSYCARSDFGILRAGPGCLRCQHGYHAEPVRCKCSAAPEPPPPVERLKVTHAALRVPGRDFEPVTASDLERVRDQEREA